jgi:hypothetical protein
MFYVYVKCLYVKSSPGNSIFIVHGVNGGTAKSFVHPDTGAIWFNDFLPREIIHIGLQTNARIWVYGYNANSAFKDGGNNVFTHAQSMLEDVHQVHDPVMTWFERMMFCLTDM